MALCQTCQAIPFRRMCTWQDGPSTFRDTSRPPFKLFSESDEPSPHTDLRRAFLRWHTSLDKFAASARVCAFCDIIHSRMIKNWHYLANVRDNDQREVWLEVPRKDPTLHVWLGDGRPEVRSSGNWRINTPPGNFSRPSLRL